MKKILTLLIIIALVVTGCSTDGNTAVTTAEESYIAVETEILKPMNLYIENIMTAKALADKDVYVVPTMAGKVEKIYVNVGDSVNKDDLLFVMDKDDINNQVNQAYAAYEAALAGYDVSVSQIENAKKTYERIEKLYEEGAVPETQYEQAKLAASDETLAAAQKNVEQSRVAYENATSALDNAEVRAPISGVISNVSIVEGEFATSSQPPITIVDSDIITVEFGVPGNMVNKIKQGDMVTVDISAADYTNEAVINSISTASNQMTNLYTVEILLENDGSIKPGMFAKVYLNTDKIDNALAVKTEAVINRNGNKIVFVTSGDLAVEREVVTGLDTGEYIEIKSGLTEGENVIIKGQDYVNDGSKIKVVRGE
ncbi:efflux RND transporter periplasmic adaptor subunit [Sedimentibacter sp. MB31-C6]|uniref:efflux RND transporter periplasmic adaptor subunit n=1 Tax=Sedimentibacter sp. MB31-C6 TaxID=3109366 RepID=UPI002DDD9E0A|nr:efflux RND transporter periplasmic adaptor subunit [Sedimentibacter sp. MB36-C1]WSI03319.1 efflux RND transporter periplasmic adaptor subunit [Sedimentibacter sp. MB36-C1]